MKYIVVELLQNADDFDDLGRDMVKTMCFSDGVTKIVYVQHPIDNRLIDVGYTFEA